MAMTGNDQIAASPAHRRAVTSSTERTAAERRPPESDTEG
jgi:hypothetical protein